MFSGQLSLNLSKEYNGSSTKNRIKPILVSRMYFTSSKCTCNLFQRGTDALKQSIKFIEPLTRNHSLWANRQVSF